MSEKSVTVATYTSFVEAELVKNELEAEGIRVAVIGEDSSVLLGSGPGLSEVQLLVHEDDVERARALIAALKEERDRGEEEEEEDDTAPQE